MDTLQGALDDADDELSVVVKSDFVLLHIAAHVSVRIELVRAADQAPYEFIGVLECVSVELVAVGGGLCQGERRVSVVRVLRGVAAKPGQVGATGASP